MTKNSHYVILLYDILNLQYHVDADVVELADTQDLGSCALWRAGSSPVIRTQEFSNNIKVTVPQLRIFLLDSDSFIIGNESRHSSFHLNPSPVQHSLVFCHAASDKTDFRD